MKILFASSEALPFVKTGGLADVSGSLPSTLRRLGDDARLILPAYPQALERAERVREMSTLTIPGVEAPVRIFGCVARESATPAYLVDIPGMFDRPGNLYTDDTGGDWPDNAQRFTAFCRTIVMVAMDRAGLDWRPDLVHLNDWQTGLSAPLLSAEVDRPATLFTIHNLSYQGLFDRETFDSLDLPAEWWSMDGLEFHQKLSMIKGGIAFADVVTTVSPTYAEEVRMPALGYGLDGLLRHRGDRFHGILNGIDYRAWNPRSDRHIPQHYEVRTISLKQRNKGQLQARFGLPEKTDAMLFGSVGRLVPQKGSDLIIDALPELMAIDDLQLVILGSGDRKLEQRIRAASEEYPDRIGCVIGYDEPLAHLIEAGSDAFLMPSRFEPCGMNQLFSLRYGTVPIVHRTGGLADTVIDASPENLLAQTATGFVFDEPTSEALAGAVKRSVDFYRRPGVFWQKLALHGMQQDFSWYASARKYQQLYRTAIEQPAPFPLAIGA